MHLKSSNLIWQAQELSSTPIMQLLNIFSTRRTHFKEALNNESLPFELDMIDEVRDHAQIQEKACRRRATQKHESKLKKREF